MRGAFLKGKEVTDQQEIRWGDLLTWRIEMRERVSSQLRVSCLAPLTNS